MNLTREKAIAEHRKMWNWIADRIEKGKNFVDIDERKDQYLEKLKIQIYPVESCFLCEYANRKKGKRYQKPCRFCPVENPDGDGCLGGLYYAVCRAETWQEQAALARQIANLPERTDV